MFPFSVDKALKSTSMFVLKKHAECCRMHTWGDFWADKKSTIPRKKAFFFYSQNDPNNP
jgi:hypothetical protein